MSRKRIRLSAIVTTLALVIAACSSGGSGGSEGNGGGAAGDLAATCPIGALDQANGPVEITFWHTTVEENRKTREALTEEFNNSQDKVKVKDISEL